MKVKYYKNIKNNEIVYEDDAQLYVLSTLGLTITGRNDGVLNEEQREFLKAFVLWYFSGNWIEEWEDIE